MLSCFVVKQQISNWSNTLSNSLKKIPNEGVATPCYSRRSSALLNYTVDVLGDTLSGKYKHESPGVPHIESVKTQQSIILIYQLTHIPASTAFQAE